MSNQYNQNNATALKETASWAKVTTNRIIKNSLMLCLVIVVLLLFNYSLHSRLSPKEIRSLYTGSFANEFNRPIDFESDGWFETEGDWQVAEGILSHTNFFAPNPTLMIPLRAGPEDTIYFSTDIHIESNRDGGGLRFNMESPNQIIHSHRVAILRQGEQTVLTGGYYEDDIEFQNQFIRYLDLEFEKSTSANLLISANSSSYDVYLNGRLIIESVPTIYPPAWHGFSAIGDSTSFERVEIEIHTDQQIEKLAELLDHAQSFGTVAATEVPLNLIQNMTEEINLLQSMSGVPNEAEWLTIDGDWSTRNNTFIQSDEAQADTHAIFQTAHNIYRIDIRLRHLQNEALGGGGILFGLEEPNSLKNGYLARFADDGSGFFYGQYNENEIFEGIGFQSFAPTQNETQKIILINNGSQFSLIVNDVIVVEGLDHQGQKGYFGLISNEAQVIFEQLIFSSEKVDLIEPLVEVIDEVLGDETLEKTEPPLNGGPPLDESPLLIVSGMWLTDGESISQNDPDPVDHIGGLDRFERFFTMTASVNMANDPDVTNSGGGFIFNMPQQDSKNGGQIVRFINNGTEVIWGYFNELGQFTGQSGVALGLQPNETQVLEVNVKDSTFEIWVNDELVAADLPLQENDGWVGLMTFGGPVTFEDLSIQSISEE